MQADEILPTFNSRMITLLTVLKAVSMKSSYLKNGDSAYSTKY